jgi:MoaA/NifB/PqqE/SkfB family radical SAM enzyme
MGNDFDEFNSWKCMLYADKCRAILEGNFLPPVVLHVYPTNSCNAHCKFCIMKTEHERKAKLDKEVFQRLIKSAIDMGIKSVHISGGGEPTLYEHLDVVRDFPGLKVLSTNGAYLTIGTYDIFDRVRVSLNAGTAETHKNIMGISNFDQVIANIRRIRKDNPKPKLGLGFVVSPDNWQDILEFCTLANDIGVDFVHIRPAYYPRGEDDDRTRKIMDAAYHLCEAAKKCCNVRIFALSDKFDGYWSSRKFCKCLASPLHAVVTATGELIVCQDVFIRFGNLYKNSLEEIWGSAEHREAISRIDVEKCPRCVMNSPNMIIEKVFVNNEIIQELL